MIVVFKLSSNETIIGDVDFPVEHMTDIDMSPYFTIHSPMVIVSDEDGMRMRDCLLLSEQNKLNFRSKDIITYYTPTSHIVDYYNKALKYSVECTKHAANEQVKLAIEDLEEAILQHTDKTSRLSLILRKLGGGNGTLQ